MRVTVSRSFARGEVYVPGSKSYTIRAAICAALSPGSSQIVNPLESDDSAAVFDCIELLGARVVRDADLVTVHGGTPGVADQPLWCRESGATLRFLAAVAATLSGVTELRCAASLARRPLSPLLEALEQLGATCEFNATSGVLKIAGNPRQCGRTTVRGDISSQFLSALLLSGPQYEAGLTVELSTPCVSERYVAMTIECMRQFGATVRASENGDAFQVFGPYRPTSYEIERDWSGAAAILALGAVAGDIRFKGLRMASLQADVAMLDLLRNAGANVVVSDEDVTVSSAPLRAFEADLGEAIDLLPAACVVGAVANGVTILTGIMRARDKESDRVAAMAEGLPRLGVPVEVDENQIRITGGAVRGGTVSSAGDHRVAMAFGVLGAAAGDVVVEGAEDVSKTYPGFWDMLSNLGVELTLHE